jgi:hypothetical protein
MGPLLLDALMAALSDLAIGLGLVLSAAVVVALVVRAEAREARRRTQAELEAEGPSEEVIPAFDFNLQPLPKAETSFERGRKAA